MTPSTLYGSPLINSSTSSSSSVSSSQQSNTSPSHISISQLSTSPMSSPPVTAHPMSTPPISTPTSTPPVSTPPITPPILTPAPNSGQYRGVTNPLVAAGLVSPDLIDILAVPLEDAAVMKRKTKRITGARDLTAGDYCRTQNVSSHFNLANYSESILSLTFSNANKNVLML